MNLQLYQMRGWGGLGFDFLGSFGIQGLLRAFGAPCFFRVGLGHLIGYSTGFWVGDGVGRGSC